jgi:hypothetical protein
MGRCKLCGQEANLVRSHVIPRSFYGIESSEGVKLLSSTEGEHPKRSPTGIYDRMICCIACEESFSPYDSYAHELLISRRSAAVGIDHRGETIGWRVPSFDYDRLKLFILGVLWRASACTHSFFERVRLGPHESFIGARLRERDPGESEDYAVFLARFPKQLGTLNPHPERYSGVNYYRLYLAEYVAYVKVDQRATPEAFRDWVIGSSSELIVLARDPKKGKDSELMRKMAKQHAGVFRSQPD